MILTQFHEAIPLIEKVTKDISVFLNTYFLLPVFLMRCSYYVASGQGNKTIDVVKNVVLYFVLITAFPQIMEILVSIPEQFQPSLFEQKPPVSVVSVLTETAANVVTIPIGMVISLETVANISYYVASSIYMILIILISSLTPFIIFANTLLGFGIGVSLFFGTLVMLSSWPLAWFSLDTIYAFIVSQKTNVVVDYLRDKIMLIFMYLLKIFVPFLLTYLTVGKRVIGGMSQINKVRDFFKPFSGSEGLSSGASGSTSPSSATPSRGVGSFSKKEFATMVERTAYTESVVDGHRVRRGGTAGGRSRMRTSSTLKLGDTAGTPQLATGSYEVSDGGTPSTRVVVEPRGGDGAFIQEKNVAVEKFASQKSKYFS